MRRLLALLALALLGACGLVVSDPEAPDGADQATTSTTASTTIPPTTTKSLVSNELTVTECPTDDGFSPLCEAYGLIIRNYVDPVDPAALADAALLGVQSFGTPGTGPGPISCPVPAEEFVRVCEELDSLDIGVEGLDAILFGLGEFGLDANSTYITAEALALVEEEQSGTVEGIGALVTTEDLTSDNPQNTTCNVISATCPLIIVSTLQGSPASAAGVQVGDVFVAVDGDPVDGRTVDEVTSLVRGPAGTDVEITFDRQGETITLVITRAAIEIPVTEAAIVGDVGYLRLNFFGGSADRQVEAELRSMLEAGVRTIVLDLRDNPGGTLEAALDVTSEFLADGLVVRTVGPDEERSYPVRGDGVATDPSIDLRVLVNRGSASASEVLAGALQERGRALIVGETTFGKNTVQQRFPLSNGGAMRLTIARWMTPGGLDFDNGIVPDVPLELDAGLTPDEIIPLVIG
ncbi:MAG TPA: S41 family peptidase [Acidimicrobiia bacterium]|nr:S41 family peptidase [Acidimicrobiia bacterium]